MEQDEIGDAMLFCLEHADAAEEVGSTPTTALRCLLPPPWLALVTGFPLFPLSPSAGGQAYRGLV